jgi:hypothetical protein
MTERFRDPRDNQAEQDVLKALDLLDAKQKAGVSTERERAAFDHLESALIHAREVDETWGDKSRGLIKDARDLLRAEFKETSPPPLRQLDLHHCEQALEILERPNFLDRVKANIHKASAKRAAARDQEKDKGRERD